MKIGIVGLPNVGKSTLFNALTKSYAADSGNFPFCTIDANTGVVDVKDERVGKLSEISNSKEKVYANIQFVDIAGLVRGASKGEGLGNKFLANVREVDAIVQVVRHFEDDDVNHVDGNVDPLRDIETINTELILSDLEQIENKLPQLQKKVKSKEKEAIETAEVLEKLKEVLENGKLIWDIKDDLSDKEKSIIKPFNFLTFKPFVYAFNVSEDNISEFDSIISEYENQLNKPVCVVSAKIEADMIDFSEKEKQEFLIEMFGDNKVPTLDDLIKTAFDEVGLMYYFTTGEKESKAWTIKKNSTAPQAAGAIHTDFERGFIKAEVVKYEDLISSGSWQKAKENGQIKLQGKDYIVQDGDVIVFKFNV
ncbi:redox-regulated ATPase YchF [Candidatus Absconditicoccus praedator]|uniref:redox-regulated ATPase YchF n=1 Tax=Candidatus Absconditicoccus praedator TaxID=2735562 RepID=UPI001E4AD526